MSLWVQVGFNKMNSFWNLLSGLCDAHRKHFQSLTPETQPPPAYHHIQAPAQPQYEQPSSPGGYQGGSGHPTQAPYHPQPASYRAPPPVSHHPQPLYQGQAALTNPVKLAEALPASHPTHSLAYEDTSQAQYQQLSSHGGYLVQSPTSSQSPSTTTLPKTAWCSAFCGCTDQPS